MARTRLVLELGTGVDLHGNDYTKSAARAVNDAIRHGSLLYLGELMKAGNRPRMFVDVTIGSPKPASVDGATVLKELPFGEKTVKVVTGGLQVGGEQDGIIISNAAVLVSFEV